MSNQSQQDRHSIRAYLNHDILLELYHYAPGPPESSPKHVHDEYQFCLSLDFPGEYFYRGARLPIPVGSLSVIHPGELHSARDPRRRDTATTFQVMYIHPVVLQELASDIARHQAGVPFIDPAVILDRALVNAFCHLYNTLQYSVPPLERQSRLLYTLTHLITRFAKNPPSREPLVLAQPALRRVRDYLHEQYWQNISLDELAQDAELSIFQLCRMFQASFGVSPHRYQTQIRVERAKKMLASGMPPSEVAVTTGFYDQSHLGRHFKKLVGVPPGMYRRNAKTS